MLASMLLLVILAIAIIYRTPQLETPLCYDEAFSYIHYAANPWPDPVFLYDYPNNHILHTVAMKFSVGAFGLSHFSLRFPALAAGLLLIAITFFTSQKLFGLPTAAIASFLVAISSTMVVYSTNGRGYSMMACCMALIWYSLHRMIDEKSTKHFVFAVMFQSLACMISPIAILGIAILHIYFFIKNRYLQSYSIRQQIKSLAYTIILSVLFYLPTILFTKEFHSESIVATTLPNLDKAKDLLNFFVGSFKYTTTGIPLFFIAMLGIGLIWGLFKDKAPRIVLVSLMIFALAYWILPMQTPPMRFVSILLPLAYILSVNSLFKILKSETIRVKIPFAYIPIILMVASLISSFNPTIARGDYDVTPIANHQKLFEEINKELKSGDAILTQFPMEASVRTYIGIYALSSDLLNPENAYSGKTAIVLSNNLNQTADLSFEKNNINKVRFLSNHMLEKRIPIDNNTTLLLYSLTDEN
ncbi:MAG: glycosyltransferase family 39 protein [Bacteroidota bacterium]